MGFKRVRPIVFVALLFATGTLGPSSFAQSAKLPLAPLTAAVSVEGTKGSQFVGSDRCQRCHAKDHGAWAKTWHANMQRKVDPAIVVADFGNVEITYRD